MITVAAIISLRNLPTSAVFGLSSIFYFGIAAIGYLIPTALVTAELATAWPKAGGAYLWVSEAFGKRTGFFALWMGWMSSVALFPILLSFVAKMSAHLLVPFFPGLEHSKLFAFGVTLSIFWGLTFLNFLGIQTSGWISSLGVIAGTLLPGALIIGLGLYWVLAGHPLQIAFTWAGLLPNFQLETMVLYSGILFALSGVEIGGYHIKDASHPKRTYPRALGMAVLIILLLSILGTLAIAVVVPQEEISLITGLIQAFTVFFKAFGLTWAVPVIVFALLIGALAGINTWVVGPAKGLLITAEDGFLPHALAKTNAHGVPTGTLIFQALIGTLLSTVFLFMDDHSAAYWLLTAAASQCTVLQYALMFAAVVRLRYSQPKTERPYEVPGGLSGVWIISIVGFLSCLFGFLIVFLPPSQLNTGDQQVFQLMLLASLLALSAPPIALMGYRAYCSRKAR
jgi:amino acid transporter